MSTLTVRVMLLMMIKKFKKMYFLLIYGKNTLEALWHGLKKFYKTLCILESFIRIYTWAPQEFFFSFSFFFFFLM